jgi:hypothetical protein
MLAAKEKHKTSIKKYRSKWHELILSDSDSDFEFNDLSDFSACKTPLSRIEKDKLKSTLNSKKVAKITWLEDDIEFDSKLKLMNQAYSNK